MERGEHEVTGLRDRERRGDGFQIAHFADQDDVGVFTKRVPERGGEALSVGADLALVDEARLVVVDELDRIFHRDDVTLAPC